MRDRSETAIALLLTATMVVAAASGSVAANANTPSIDTSTTSASADHGGISTHSEVTDGGNITNFAGDGGNNTTIQYTAYTNSSKLVWMAGNNGTQIYSNSSPTTVDWNASSSPAHGHFNVTTSHDALHDLERGINENVTTTVKIINDTGNDTEVAGYATVYVESDNSSVVENFDDTDVDDEDDVETVSEDGLEVLGLSLSDGSDHTAIDFDDRSIDGENTDVFLVFSNGTVDSDYDTALDDTNPIFGLGGEAEDGDLLLTMPLRVEDDDGNVVAVPVFYKEVPDYFDEDQTHALYTEDIGGETGIEIVTGDELDDADELSVESWGNTGFQQAWSVYGTNAVIGFDGITVVVPVDLDGLTATLPLVVVGLQRRDRRRPPRNGPAAAGAQAQSRMATAGV